MWKNWYSFLIGLLLGWAFISEFPTAIIIIALACYYIYAIWRNPNFRHFRSIILPFLGGAIPIIILLVYNKLCFGNFLSLGYAHESNPIFYSAMAQGLMGIGWPNLLVLY